MSDKQRPSEDNVIYANFGARRRVSRPEETGGPQVQGQSQRQGQAPRRERRRNEIPRIMGPAARRILQSALDNTDDGREKRGREYAGSGKVLEVTPRRGGFDAVVAGSQNDPFNVGIQLPRRSVDDIQGLLEHMAQQVGAVENAKRGRLPEEALSVLLAPDTSSIRFFCTCPDDAAVCKHSVAAAVKAAELCDADPSTVFSLRGLNLFMLERGVRRQATEVAKQNAAEGSEFFWQGRELPGLPDPKVAPMVDDSDLDLLHRAMQSVSFTNIDQMRAVADIEDLYDELTRDT